MSPSIVHRLLIAAPETHLVHVETTISGLLGGWHGDVGPASGVPASGAPASASAAYSIVLAMPVWTPGSYLVREYARHVEGFVAAEPARASKIRKNAWRIETAAADEVIVRYRVYAGELTVRTSHVDDTHAFLVGAALFLYLEGHETLGATIEIACPAGWRAATPLARLGGDHGKPTDDAVLRFRAPDFDTLVDSPIELGTHRDESFEAAGKPHHYAIWPANAVTDADARRLVDDTRKILETEARLFGGALPYDAYELLLHLSPRGRGGLEHLSSSALIASPSSFATRDAYLDLLSLVAHEVFHAWNIKRIRPAGLTPYRYGEENYTRLLWWFEGGTSYYDWRVLTLAGLCTIDEYLDHLAGEIAYLDQTPGRLVHALEEASFDAWIKLYRPDENSLNSTVSYYRKGEIVCALLDLELRSRTAGRATLDKVLAHLWTEFGAIQRPVPEGAMQAIFERVAGVPLGDLFDSWIRSPSEIDSARTLATVGLLVERASRADGASCSLGIRTRSEGGRLLVATVSRLSGGARAGIDPGDELVAIGGTRIEGTSLDAALRGRSPGVPLVVTLTRDGRLFDKTVTPDVARQDRVKVVVKADASAAARAALTAWLGRSP